MAAAQTSRAGNDAKADTGDTWQVGFDEPVQLTDGHFAQFNVQAPNFGSWTLDCTDTYAPDNPQRPSDVANTEVYCTVTDQPTTIDGQLFAAGEAVTVRLEQPLNDDNDPVFYPVDFMTVVGVTDADGQLWIPKHSADRRVGPDTIRRP